jgi:RNA polymerase sigma-70 factor (ECF subfamily)
MPQSPGEFDILMAKVRLGDSDALAQLVQVYENEVRRTARCMLGRALRSYLEPADLVQSVHRTLLVGLRQNKFQITTPQKLLALAATVTRHKILQHARHWQCQQRHSLALAETDAADGTRTMANGSGSDPARAAEFKDTIEHLCSTLDDTSRRLVELRLQGYSTAEVARQLGISADILRVRLSRLRQRWRERKVLTNWI